MQRKALAYELRLENLHCDISVLGKKKKKEKKRQIW